MAINLQSTFVGMKSELKSPGSSARKSLVHRSRTVRSSARVHEQISFPSVEMDNVSSNETTQIHIKHKLRYESAAEALSSSGMSVDSSEDTEDFKTFHITDVQTGGKVTQADRLQKLRHVFVQNILTTLGEDATDLAPEEVLSPHELVENEDLPTVVRVVPALVADTNTILYIETRNYSGLLFNVNQLLKDLNVKVVSTKVHEAEGRAFITLYSTHRGGHLSRDMKEMVVNFLQYYLALPTFSDEHSY